jgi:alanyl-tRNA synthetase
MDAIGNVTGAVYHGYVEDFIDVSFRVIADHLRMLTFAITDGALPGNKGRGAVLRSVLRRAFRFGYQYLQQRDPFIHKLVPALVAQMGVVYPELKNNPKRVEDVIQGEESDFLRTIERGMFHYEEAKRQAKKLFKLTGSSNHPRLRGIDIFTLRTTFGFPPDLTLQMAREDLLEVDIEEYEQLMREHEEKSRGKKTEAQVALNVTGGLLTTDDRPKWFGPTCEGKVLGWIAENQFQKYGRAPEEKEIGLLLDKTCFYAEQGGQVGDQGTIRTPTGLFEVSQTVKVGNAVVHVGQVTEARIEVGQKADLAVSTEREFTRKNHTATHLLHWALHQVLGEHVEQRGSKVKPDEFTFDFSHTGPLTWRGLDSEMDRVEQLVNQKIYEDLPVIWRELPIQEARMLPGVRAFFGDKYGDVVRVVEIGGGFSREFCGGTHVEKTGQIGFFTIEKEEGVGKGIRRLTCKTAGEAVRSVQKPVGLVMELADELHCKWEELPDRVKALQEEIRRLQQQLKKGAVSNLADAADKLLSQASEVNGAKLIVGEMPAGPAEALQQQLDRLRQKAGSAVVCVGWSEDGKVGLMAAVTDDLTGKVHAGKLVGEAAKVVGGKGGGRPGMAQAGGKDPSKLTEALQLARKLAAEQLAK